MQINVCFQRTPSKFLLDAVPTPEQPASGHALCSEQTQSSGVSLCSAETLNSVMKKNANSWAKQQIDLHEAVYVASREHGRGTET